MTDPSPSDLALPVGETLLALWPARWVRDEGGTELSGYLVVTSWGCRFHAKAGLLSRRRVSERPDAAWPFESLGSVAADRFWLRIGYGDRVEIPVVRVGRERFRLDREESSARVVLAIESARRGRGRAAGGRP